jgi:hypothetical protein
MSEENVESRPQNQQNPGSQQQHGGRPQHQHHRGGGPQQQRPGAVPAPTVNPDIEPIDLSRLKQAKIPELHAIAQKGGIEVSANLRKQDLIFEILKWQSDQQGAIQGGGVLEGSNDGYGFLREPAYNYEPSPDDIYCAPSIMRGFGLRTHGVSDCPGHHQSGHNRPDVV